VPRGGRFDLERVALGRHPSTARAKVSVNRVDMISPYNVADWGRLGIKSLGNLAGHSPLHGIIIAPSCGCREHDRNAI
jgi:hypothetical protein